MGFVQSLFGQPNPTRRWQFDPSVPLVLDLDQHTLSGVGIGAPLERLSFLGKGIARGSIDFPALGLAVSEADGRIHELIVYFGHPAEPDGGKFAGIVRHRGQTLELSAAATEPWLRARLGEPYWRDEDSQEAILFYEHGRHEWQVEFADDGRLKCLVICQPLLADEEQRRAFGVTKAWPPTAEAAGGSG
jgi:hypothetical protein